MLKDDTLSLSTVTATIHAPIEKFHFPCGAHRAAGGLGTQRQEDQ